MESLTPYQAFLLNEPLPELVQVPTEEPERVVKPEAVKKPTTKAN